MEISRYRVLLPMGKQRPGHRQSSGCGAAVCGMISRARVLLLFFPGTAYVTALPFSFSFSFSLLFFFSPPIPHSPPPAVDRRSVWREFCLLFARFLPLQQFSSFLSLQAAVQNTGKQAGEREGDGEWETGRVLHVWFYLWTCLAVSERVRRVFPWCRLSSLFYASPSVALCIFAIRRILRVPVSQAHLFLLE